MCDQSASRAEAFKIEDDAVQKGVLRRIANDFIAIDRDRKEAERLLESDGHAFVNSGDGSVDDFMKDHDTKQAVDAVPGLEESMRKAEKMKAQGQTWARVDDGVTFIRLTKMPLEDFVRLDLSAFQHLLTQAQDAEINRMQKADIESLDAGQLSACNSKCG